jgi:hypothetical protein
MTSRIGLSAIGHNHLEHNTRYCTRLGTLRQSHQSPGTAASDSRLESLLG